jgi:hypothetical protein
VSDGWDLKIIHQSISVFHRGEGRLLFHDRSIRSDRY